MKTFQDLIIKLKETKSVEEICHGLDISQRTYAGLRSGASSPTIKTAIKYMIFTGTALMVNKNAEGVVYEVISEGDLLVKEFSDFFRDQLATGRKALIDKLGVSPTFIRSLESGRQLPPITLIADIGAARGAGVIICSDESERLGVSNRNAPPKAKGVERRFEKDNVQKCYEEFLEDVERLHDMSRTEEQRRISRIFCMTKAKALAFYDIHGHFFLPDGWVPPAEALAKFPY